MLELAVVLVLVGCMAVVCVPPWREGRTFANVAQVHQDLNTMAAVQWTHFQNHGHLFAPAGGVAQSGWYAWHNNSNFSPNSPGNFAQACSLLWEQGSFYDSKGDSTPAGAAAVPAGSIHYDLRVMTSPLEYLPDLPTDPFKPATSSGTVLTYEFFGVDLRASFALRSLGPDRDADSGCSPFGFACGCFAPFCLSLTGRIGEDRPFDPAARTEFECPRCATLLEALTWGGTVYSPTNGSVSNGDIYLTSAQTVPVGGRTSSWRIR